MRCSSINTGKYSSEPSAFEMGTQFPVHLSAVPLTLFPVCPETICDQTIIAANNASCAMPSSSGQINYSDFDNIVVHTALAGGKDGNLCSCVIRKHVRAFN